MPHKFTVKEAAKIMGMTAGGLRGAILRGKLRAEKDDDGKIQIASHNLAAFHLYGDCQLFPEADMTPTNKLALHDYLETMNSA